MTDRVYFSATGVLLVALVLVGCAQTNTAVEADTITDATSLAEYLRESNISLLDQGPSLSQQMSVPGNVYTVVSGGVLRVFKYPTDADALADIAQLERGRNVRRTRHLYRKADLVVIYEGDDPRMQQALLRVFGARIS